MRAKLRSKPLDRSQRADCRQLPFCPSQNISCEYVAEEVGLEVVVLRRAEGIVKWFATQLCLNFRSDLESVKVLWNRRSLRADLGLLSVSGSLIQNLLESSKSVHGARKSGVGVQMGEDLLHLIDCKSVIETVLYA